MKNKKPHLKAKVRFDCIIWYMRVGYWHDAKLIVPLNKYQTVIK